MTTRPLGRVTPTDWEHVEKYPLTARTVPAQGVPVFMGTNWYSGMDEPWYDTGTQRWWIGRNSSNLGYVRGGHAYVLKPPAIVDNASWWKFYDQGQEGACVGFSISRGMTLLNRKRFQAHWLYKEAQKVDEWEGEDYEGTSVRAGLEVLRTVGHVPTARFRLFQRYNPKAGEGISEYRWATDVEQIIEVLGGVANLYEIGGVPMLNSWGAGGYREGHSWVGNGWPHTVYIPFETLEILLRQDGEAGLISDR